MRAAPLSCLVVLLVGMALPSPSAAAQADSLTVEARFIRALMLLQTGDAGGAEEALEQVLEARPSDPGALAAMARVQNATGDPDAAAFYARQAFEAAPAETGLADLLADLLRVGNRTEEAVAVRRAAFEAAPSDARRLDLAEELAEAGQEDAAQRELRALPATAWPRVLARIGRTVDPATGRARSLLLAPALALAPEDPWLQAWSDTLPRRAASPDAPPQGGPDEPASLDAFLAPFRDAARGSAADPAARRRYGALLLAAGDAEAAADVLAALTRDAPADLAAWPLAADALRRSGRPEDAAALAEEALFLFPDQPALLRARAEALAALARLDEAAALVDDALRFAREDGDPTLEASVLRARLALARTGGGDAVTAQTALDALDESPGVLEQRGIAEAEAGRIEEARTLWERALALAPSDPDLVLRLRTRLLVSL